MEFLKLSCLIGAFVDSVLWGHLRSSYYVEMVLVPPLQTLLHPPLLFRWEGQGELVQSLEPC